MTKPQRDLVIGIVAAAVLIGATLALTSCDDRPQAVAVVPQAGQPAPVVVAQQSDDHFWRDMWLYQTFFGGSRTTVVEHHYVSPRPAYVAPRAPTVVNNTTIVNKTVIRPAAPTPAPRPAPSYSAPRVTSYAGSYSSRPSYSSYSSRASFSGGRR